MQSKLRQQGPHIAILPMLGDGHLYPLLPMCSALAARGYRVSCACDEQYISNVQDVGLEPVLVPNSSVTRRYLDDLNRRLSSQRPIHDPIWWETNSTLRCYMHMAIADLLHCLDFYSDSPPSLVIYDRNYLPGWVMAKLIDCPAIQVSPSFAYFGRFVSWHEGVGCFPTGAEEATKAVDALLSSYGPRFEDTLRHVERLNIHFIPEGFQYEGDPGDNRFFFAGACLDRHFDHRWSDCSGGRPIVLVSYLSGLRGMHFDTESYYGVVLRALSRVECHCILSIWKGVPRESLGRLPANVEINQHASHLEILPHAALAVCHAGMGTTLEALYNGVPVLGIPPFPGCEEIAYRVADLGLGTRLPMSEFNEENAREAVRAMLSDSAMQSRVKQTQQRFRTSGGAAAAADEVEDFLARR